MTSSALARSLTTYFRICIYTLGKEEVFLDEPAHTTTVDAAATEKRGNESHELVISPSLL